MFSGLLSLDSQNWFLFSLILLEASTKRLAYSIVPTGLSHQLGKAAAGDGFDLATRRLSSEVGMKSGCKFQPAAAVADAVASPRLSKRLEVDTPLDPTGGGGVLGRNCSNCSSENLWLSLSVLSILSTTPPLLSAADCLQWASLAFLLASFLISTSLLHSSASRA